MMMTTMMIMMMMATTVRESEGLKDCALEMVGVKGPGHKNESNDDENDEGGESIMAEVRRERES